MPDSGDDLSEEEEEEYPPWLENIVTGENYYDKVKVLSVDETDKTQKGHKRCKEIEVPDAADAAENTENPSKIRRYRLRRFTPVLIVSTPQDPPYIGLIDKIWLAKKAIPVPGTTDTYRTSDFKLECYWFYRPREVPANAWVAVRRKAYSAAKCVMPNQRQSSTEQFCERQLLFSSHHTRHDYPDDNGLLSLEGFLQTCTLHWLGLRELPPERCCIKRGQLVRTREPGFVVQGFLWCGAKEGEQYHPEDKIAYALEDSWGVKGDEGRETKKMVELMLKRYQPTAKQFKARNKTVMSLAAEHKALRSLSGAAVQPLSDDDGDTSEERQQQRDAKLLRLQQQREKLQQQQQQQKQKAKSPSPPSPQLPGVEAAAAASAPAAADEQGGFYDFDDLEEVVDDELMPAGQQQRQPQPQQNTQPRRPGHARIESDDDD